MLQLFVAKKVPQWRCIRSYRRIAEKSYDCSKCNWFIESGMPYYGEVWVCGNLLRVKRYHDYCPEFYDDEFRTGIEPEPEAAKPEKIEARMAA